MADEIAHRSGCAVNNAPALPPGPCDCGAHRCENCRYWSQMCAQSIGCGPIEALCLNAECKRLFRKATETCPHWAVNRHGAWDEPPDYGETARAKYEAESEALAAETEAMAEHAGKVGDFLP